jgi:signal transduction histidine kinase
VTCTLRHPVDLPANQVFCSIIDQGYGIAAADQARLFQRFQRGGKRGDMTNRPHHDGIGLGLVFVKTVVERHQGQLGFSSELGEGTTFTVTLPCCRID